MGAALRPIAAGLILGAFAVPVVLGLLGTLMTALGGYPGAGSGWHVLQDPRLVAAVTSTLVTGLAATALALSLAIAVVVLGWNRPSMRFLRHLLAPFLAVPHAALAVGLVFLLAPSGWLARLVAPLAQWARPPDSWVVPDAWGLSLILGLALKELPFLLFTALAYLPRLDPEASLRQGRLLGYAPSQCWSRLILPRLLPLMRLPIGVVLAYNLTVVDMALILGPGQPPTLAVAVVEYFYQPGGRAPAALASLGLLGVLAIGFVLAQVAYRLIARWRAQRCLDGQRRVARPAVGMGVWALLWGVWCLISASLAALAVWSVTQRWRFPDIWPSTLTLRFWTQRWEDWWPLIENTLALALLSSLLAVASALVWLELERHRQVPRLDGLWYVPLFIPQVCVLLGWQAGALLIGADAQFSTLVWAHWVYALPYALLVLAGPWRALDPGFERQAQLLGAGYLRRLGRVRIPLLLRALLSAWAVAMSVSIAQYLPTLLLGAGRFPTLTTELVTSFGGVDRRVIGTLASLQMLLPWLAFALALAIPAGLYRRRRGA